MNSLLSQDIMYLPGVGPRRREILERQLNIKTWGDLLEYYPYKYVDRSKVYAIRELRGDMPEIQIKGHILRYEEVGEGRKKRVIGHFTDGQDIINLVWFHPGKWIYENYKVGEEFIVFGKPSPYNGFYQIVHPDMEKADKIALNEMGMQPYYITTQHMKDTGLTSHALEKLTKTLVKRLPEGSISETLLPSQLSRLHLIPREEALRNIHYPKTLREVQKAQERLKFEELFYVQLNILRYATAQRNKYRGYRLPEDWPSSSTPSTATTSTLS